MNKLGVEVKIFLNGKVIIPDGDGFLGNQFFRGDRILLELGAVIKRERGYICVLDVDGKKNISFKRNYSSTTDRYIFRSQIHIHIDSNKIPYTRYPSNNTRILHIYKNGHVQLWEIAVISRNGNFFLTKQMIYDCRCYNNDGKLDCRPPNFNKWLQMLLLLSTHLVIKNLPPITQCREKILIIDQKKLKRGTGIVQWWNNAQGLGVIITPHGAARVHWTNVFPTNGSRLIYLTAGATVKYTKLIAPQHVPKKRGTTFQLEAVGVYRP